MKRSTMAALALLCAAFATARGLEVQSRRSTISEVVASLQGMLDQSKTDGLAERDLYAKYKCYCDTNEEEKSTSVEDLTKQIALLASEISGLQGGNGELSVEVAELQADMAKNQEAQDTATTLRAKQNKEFTDLKTDLDSAIQQLGLAIDTLTEIGADQTLQASAAHQQFMAGYDSSGGNAGSLLILKQSVQKAMAAAESFLPNDMRRRAKILLQAPFTGNYVSQAGEVVGILKSMKETFESNLETATATEAAQLEAYNAFIQTQGDAMTKMQTAHDVKQGTLSGNDQSLSTKQTALGTAQTQKSDDEDFLASLTDMCEDKAKDYEKRKMFRANEEAAIAKAIAILNSDQSAALFGKVQSGSGASFVQLAAVRRHVQRAAPAPAVRTEVQRLLRQAAHAHKSKRLARVAALLSVTENPFTVVLAEIKKMLDLVDKEAKQDKEHLDWCNNERAVNNRIIADKNQTITNIEGDITQLDEDINHPEAGLKAMIELKETSLEANRQQQTDETATRREENAQYQTSVGDMVKAEGLIEKAIEMLQRYYEDMDNKQLGLVQRRKAEPAPPSTWEGNYAGQKSSGNQVIATLESIHAANHGQQTTAHDAEVAAQHAYEDSMEQLTKDEKDLVDELATLRKDLADAKLELEGKYTDLDQTIVERRAIIRYLESIAPPCDFITNHYNDRESFRAEEKTALETAESKLKGTPAYIAAAAADKRQEQGKCADICEATPDHVDCKACLADVSVPGYCASHPTTVGC